MSETAASQEHPVVHTEKVGAFDIRNFIGALIGLYGVILTILGLVGFDASESARTGGVNANLWAGLAMLAFGVLFMLWARLQPLTVTVAEDSSGDGPPTVEAADAGPVDKVDKD